MAARALEKQGETLRARRQRLGINVAHVFGGIVCDSQPEPGETSMNLRSAIICVALAGSLISAPTWAQPGGGSMGGIPGGAGGGVGTGGAAPELGGKKDANGPAGNLGATPIAGVQTPTPKPGM